MTEMSRRGVIYISVEKKYWILISLPFLKRKFWKNEVCRKFSDKTLTGTLTFANL